MNATMVAQRTTRTSGNGISINIANPNLDTAKAVFAARSLVTRTKTWVGSLSVRARILISAAVCAIFFTAVGIWQGPQLTGYLGVFGFSVLSNAVLFLPSGRGVVMVSGALVLNPLAVAVLTGIGGAVGEITGYALGRSSRKFVKGGKGPAWLSRSAEKHMAPTLLAVSIIPNPFVDVIGIVAGRAGYPVKLFLTYSIIGKVIQSIAFVYIALWNISLLSNWIDLPV
ncbi:VTT domain-containing protein [Chloroflexota bacterium]